MSERLDRLKEHFRKNKVIYSCGLTAFGVAGITYTLMRGRHASVQRVLDGSDLLSESITVRPLSFFTNRNTNNIVNVIEREGRGHPGYLVRCIETGEGWISQIKAADAANTYPSVMSGHLTGKIPDVHGLHYERIGINE